MTGGVLQSNKQNESIESNRCCCVKSHPDLQLDSFVLDFEGLHGEVHSDSVRVSFGEDISGFEAGDDAFLVVERGFLVVEPRTAIKNHSLPAFSNSAVAYQHYFEQQIKVFAHAVCDCNI